MKTIITFLKQDPVPLSDYIQAKVHHDFTVSADNMAMKGILSVEERIALSNAIGDVLQALRDNISKNPDLKAKVITPEQFQDLRT